MFFVILAVQRLLDAIRRLTHETRMTDAASIHRLNPPLRW
jgi:hypothetical protein